MKAARPTILPAVPIADRDHLQGSIDAPIRLLEYGDFECPFCGAAYPLVKEIQQELGQRLCFAFRHFPMTTVHLHAEHAAEAAEAAAEQGRFWEMHDILFENQDDLDDEDLAQCAETLGLDAQRLLAEVQSGAYRPRVREDFRSGVRSGVNGTPTFFINGQRYDGERILQEMLASLTAAV